MLAYLFYFFFFLHFLCIFCLINLCFLLVSTGYDSLSTKSFSVSSWVCKRDIGIPNAGCLAHLIRNFDDLEGFVTHHHMSQWRFGARFGDSLLRYRLCSLPELARSGRNKPHCF